MTRKEQVTNKVKEIVHESGYNAIPSTLFEMATWADKTMIEKACEWITEHIDIPYEGEFIDDIPVDYVEYHSKRLEYAKAIADAFKQAMEE